MADAKRKRIRGPLDVDGKLLRPGDHVVDAKLESRRRGKVLVAGLRGNPRYVTVEEHGTRHEWTTLSTIWRRDLA